MMILHTLLQTNIKDLDITDITAKINQRYCLLPGYYTNKMVLFQFFFKELMTFCFLFFILLLSLTLNDVSL